MRGGILESALVRALRGILLASQSWGYIEAYNFMGVSIYVGRLSEKSKNGDFSDFSDFAFNDINNLQTSK